MFVAELSSVLGCCVVTIKTLNFLQLHQILTQWHNYSSNMFICSQKYKYKMKMKGIWQQRKLSLICVVHQSLQNIKRLEKAFSHIRFSTCLHISTSVKTFNQRVFWVLRVSLVHKRNKLCTICLVRVSDCRTLEWVDVSDFMGDGR